MIKLPQRSQTTGSIPSAPKAANFSVAKVPASLPSVRVVKADVKEQNKVSGLLALSARVDGNTLVYPENWWKVPEDVAAKFTAEDVASYENKLNSIESAFRIKNGVLFGEVFNEFMKFTQAAPHLTPLVTDKHLEYVIGIARDLALLDFTEKQAKTYAKASKSKDYVADFSNFDFNTLGID